MRSNGAAHLGNDTFLAATRDRTESLFLFSSSFPTEERLAALPLARKARFSPHSDLFCSANENAAYIAAAADSLERSSKATRQEQPASALLSDPAAPPLRHTFIASPDGHQVAAISNGRWCHFVIDVTEEPAGVCELRMEETVRSACWSPVERCMLYVLFVTGDLMIFDTSRSRISVVLPYFRRIALRPLVHRCLLESGESGCGAATGAAPAAATAAKLDKDTGKATLPDKVAVPSQKPKSGPHRTKKDAVSSSSHDMWESPARWTEAMLEDPSIRSPSIYDPHAKKASSPPRAATKTAAAARPASADVMPIDKEPEDDNEGGNDATTAAAGVSDQLQRRTSQLDLVDLHILPPTRSIPSILLLLSSSGDVYAAPLGDDLLPLPKNADTVDDGRLRTVGAEQARLESFALRPPVRVEMHHLIAGELGEKWDEALGLRGCLVDADAGTHAVFYATANGTVKGAWVGEPDLLARHRVAHTRASGAPNISFSVRLDERVGDVRERLSRAVPSTTHTITMSMSANLCLLRRGASGAATYLLAMPCWDRARGGWACWQPAPENAEASSLACRSLPLLSTDAAVPSPVALRLPYDTRGASVAMGEQEVLLVPEVSTLDAAPSMGSEGCRRLLSLRIFSLLRAELYSRCGPMQLHPPSNALKPPAVTTITTTSAAVAAAAAAAPPPQPPLTNAASRHAAVLKMVDSVPECHRAWLRAAPAAEVDTATTQLLALVEAQVKDTEQQERMQTQRRERLMARLAALEARVQDMNKTYDRWQQTMLDAVVHRRNGAAVRTANERLGDVHKMLNEWEQMQ